MTVGEHIAQLRKGRGATQEQLAYAVGVSAPAVSKWETDQSLPDISLLGPIARYFGITIDDLLLFKRELSEQETAELAAGITGIFESKGHAEGLDACRARIREYPDSTYLKLKIAGIYSRYLLWVRQEDRTEENLQEFLSYAVSLLEDLLKTDRCSVRYWMQAKGMLACYLVQMGEFERAEVHLKELPRPELNPDELYAMLCLQKGDYAKADEYSRRNWRNYGMAALHSVGFLMRSAWEVGEEARVEQLAGAYAVLGELLGSDDGVGYDYRIRLALRRNQLDQAERWFWKMAKQWISLACGSADGDVCGPADGDVCGPADGDAGGPAAEDDSGFGGGCIGTELSVPHSFDAKTKLHLLENYRQLYLGDENYLKLRESRCYQDSLAYLEKCISEIRHEIERESEGDVETEG